MLQLRLLRLHHLVLHWVVDLVSSSHSVLVVKEWLLLGHLIEACSCNLIWLQQLSQSGLYLVELRCFFLKLTKQCFVLRSHLHQTVLLILGKVLQVLDALGWKNYYWTQLQIYVLWVTALLAILLFQKLLELYDIETFISLDLWSLRQFSH